MDRIDPPDANLELPREVASHGEAPKQYDFPDEDDWDGGGSDDE